MTLTHAKVNKSIGKIKGGIIVFFRFTFSPLNISNSFSFLNGKVFNNYCFSGIFFHIKPLMSQKIDYFLYIILIHLIIALNFSKVLILKVILWNG